LVPKAGIEPALAGRPEGFSVKYPLSGDFPSFPNVYKSSAWKCQVGKVWIFLGNCRLGRFHSNYNAKGLPPIYYDEERNVAARDVDSQGPDALQGVDYWVAHGIEESGGGMR
jgi:hypothetical protein